MSLFSRVAPDLIFFQIRPGPDLAGFGTADPAGAGAGLETNVLELEA